uniref:Uncharacterized protein n=1 Tax=Cacopsylla melanoneura TaxID=428564 RepID=A0A8D8RVI3_9HEMI
MDVATTSSIVVSGRDITTSRKPMTDICKESVIILEDSDEENTPEDSEGICLTQLELNVLTERREYFHKTEVKTVELYQLLIEEEIACLSNVIQRHRRLGDETIGAHPYMVHAKTFISGLCLDLIANNPSEVSYWDQYMEFCVELDANCTKERGDTFESILRGEDVSASVYVQMGYTEHNISGNYTKARDYLSRGLEKHKHNVDLYSTRLQLEVGECYAMREQFSGERVYNEGEKTILLGDHLMETYNLMKTNLNLTDSSVLDKLDELVNTTCEEFPCYPVTQLKKKLCQHWNQTVSSSVEAVDMKAKLHLNDTAITDINCRDKLVGVFQTYWKAFVSNKNPKILHRAITSFSLFDLSSPTVRRLLYILLDVGLFYRCLEPQHVSLYFAQLRLENNPIADMKTKLVFRQLGSDPRLSGNEAIWHIKLSTFLNLYGTDTGRLTKLMEMAASSLASPVSLLTVFCRALTRTLSNSDEATLRFVKAVYSLLHAHVAPCSRTQEKLRRALITWLIGRGRASTAKYQYTRLRGGEGGKCVAVRDGVDPMEEGRLHTELLGQLLLYNPVKRDPGDT